MARQIRALWLVLSWSGFCHTDRFRGNGHKLRIFLFSKAGKFKTNMARVPYNKLLTNLACSSRTEEYWPEVVAVRTERSEVRTKTTSGQYSPVRPLRSGSKRLIFHGCSSENSDSPCPWSISDHHKKFSTTCALFTVYHLLSNMHSYNKNWVPAAWRAIKRSPILVEPHELLFSISR